MAYFKNYYSTLIELKNTIINDVKELDDDKRDDNRLIASMLNFAKEVGQLAQAAANNSAIEVKASLMPEGVKTHWWAGSGSEPPINGDHESLSPHPSSDSDSGSGSESNSDSNP